MKEVLIVGLGGFLGTISRYSIYLFSTNFFPDRLYIATGVINSIGCLFIGILGSGIIKSNSPTGLFLMIGLCGGFTTFSSYALDGLKLLKAGMYFNSIIYIIGSTIIGLVLCFLGFIIGNKFQ